jgi:hypothetical protein
MGNGKRKGEKADARGGGFFLLPQCLLNSQAFRTASPRAIKVLMALCAKHTGFNNGAIGLGFRELAEWLDSQNHAANSRALCQLIERGLVTLERDYPRGQRLAREYRLTFVPAGYDPATNDYLNWRPGDAGTCRKRPGGNFRVEATATRSAVRVEATATGGETSRCGNRNGVDAKPPILGPSPVAIPATHITNQLGVRPSSPRQSVQNSGRPPSAAPDAEELRGRVLAALGEAGRGSQGQLAAMAAIRPAALSKFLNNGGPLNDLARVRLTCALPKLGVSIPERLTA